MLKKYSILLLAVLSLIFITSRSFADIIVISADGVVNPVMSEFISKSIDYAAENNSELVVIKLDTPGGLDTSMRVIVKKIISSEVPVAVFVSPSGARAASAGVFITMSAHIASMSPGTNIGAAHPVSVGSKMDKDMAEKVVNDSAAYIRSIAEKKNRNSEWAEKAVRESVSITAKEALKLNVIDLVSKDTAALLEAVDGR
ncbi:MAG TPA: nodulation protein NfeD, partial [Nitrospirae bacterium]|nr:nodulation protein NfeD [Nitrospirota bacterium]